MDMLFICGTIVLIAILALYFAIKTKTIPTPVPPTSEKVVTEVPEASPQKTRKKWFVFVFIILLVVFLAVLFKTIIPSFGANGDIEQLKENVFEKFSPEVASVLPDATITNINAKPRKEQKNLYYVTYAFDIESPSFAQLDEKAQKKAQKAILDLFELDRNFLKYEYVSGSVKYWTEMGFKTVINISSNNQVYSYDEIALHNPPKENTHHSPSAPSKWDKLEQETVASIHAEEFVKKQLNYPLTAEFPSYTEYKYYFNGDDYTVTGYVDADNGFGVPKRMNWILSFTVSNNGDNATLTNILIDESIPQ